MVSQGGIYQNFVWSISEVFLRIFKTGIRACCVIKYLLRILTILVFCNDNAKIDTFIFLEVYKIRFCCAVVLSLFGHFSSFYKYRSIRLFDTCLDNFLLFNFYFLNGYSVCSLYPSRNISLDTDLQSFSKMVSD